MPTISYGHALYFHICNFGEYIANHIHIYKIGYRVGIINSHMCYIYIVPQLMKHSLANGTSL